MHMQLCIFVLPQSYLSVEFTPHGNSRTPLHSSPSTGFEDSPSCSFRPPHPTDQETCFSHTCYLHRFVRKLLFTFICTICDNTTNSYASRRRGCVEHTTEIWRLTSVTRHSAVVAIALTPEPLQEIHTPAAILTRVTVAFVVIYNTTKCHE